MTGTIISGDRRIGGPALDDRIARASAGFAAQGLTAGDAVALLLRNDVAFFEATFGAGQLGIYPVPVNWHFSGEEVAYILTDSGAKVLVAHADLLGPVQDFIPPGVTVLTVATPPEIASAYGVPGEKASVPAGATDWDQWLNAQTPYQGAVRPAPASMIYTSGTTGKPKGVRRMPPDEGQAAATLAARKYVFDFGPEMISVMTGPLYHSAPNLYGTFTLRVGGTLHLMPKFDAEGFLAQVERDRISHVHVVPTMFVRLLKLPDAVKRKYDLSSLKHVIHGAAPCPPDVKRAMIEWFGPVIHEYYGGTESGAAVHCSSAEWLAHPGSVGKPIPGAEVKIFSDDGRELPIGETGEIFIRLWSFPDFTYHGRDDDRRAIDRAGLITCGDVGYLDADGYVYLQDRKRDMVISGGVNIYPAEIEKILITMPGVRDCAVFGIPDPEFGEGLAAAIETDSPLSVEAVRTWLGERMAKYKVPKLVTFHDRLPREDTGKIFKRKLRDPYWAHLGRAI